MVSKRPIEQQTVAYEIGTFVVPDFSLSYRLGTALEYHHLEQNDEP